MAVQAQLYAENLGFPLGGSQDLLLMDNACGFNDFSFNLQQQQQQRQQQQQQQNQQMQFHHLQNMQENRNQSFCFDKNVLRPENNPSLVFDQNFAPPLMKKQRLDIDRLISLQSERLRLALQEQKRQQLAFLLKKYESETQILLRQKDEEIARAVNRTMELEDLLLKMETENQAWQRVAKENEAIIITLNNTMDQLRENACQTTGNGGVDDAESCCDIMTSTEKRTAEQTRMGGNWEHEPEHGSAEHKTRNMICKSCNSRNSCFILLPCRHLCSCNVCEAYIVSCPVCKMPKKGSIEALI